MCVRWFGTTAINAWLTRGVETGKTSGELSPATTQQCHTVEYGESLPLHQTNIVNCVLEQMKHMLKEDPCEEAQITACLEVHVVQLGLEQCRLSLFMGMN